jgi:tRNA pseudouridine55 synthase
LDGILNVNKPAGWTSFDVVAVIRGGSRQRRVGHAGTLDPAATGVLPVCLGSATRVIEYLFEARKTYVARVRLGIETDTYDGEGRVVAEREAGGVERAEVERALGRFRGEIEQVAPAFSAIKRDGVPLYRRARAGEAVTAPSRRVLIHRLELLAFEPPYLTLEVECGKGTYVRSLAHDLGRALAVGGSLAALERTRVGGFTVGDAVDLDRLRQELASGAWTDRLIAADAVLLDWPAAILDGESSQRLRNGRPLSIAATAATPPVHCRAYTTGGDFLAVLRHEDGPVWLPEKVFPANLS